MTPSRKGPPRPSTRAQPSKQRRAFSPARSGGAVTRGGHGRTAAALADALGEARRDRVVADSVTHPLHAYPARMHPATARALVELIEPRVVVDPFCGSGTTLVEARFAGAQAIGVDANPLAVLIARAKTWTAPKSRRQALREHGQAIAAAALAEGKAARRAGYEEPPLRKPAGVDPNARDRALKDWFAPHVRRELEHLASLVDALATEDAELAERLTVVLSSVIYKVSRRASDSDPSRVERRVARGAAARLFAERVELLLAGLEDLRAASAASPGVVHEGDARALGLAGLADGMASAVITSPPYAGTYDYAEQHRLRLDFLAMPVKRFAGAEMGARRGFSGSDAQSRRRARRAWERDITAAIAEMGRILAPSGRAVLMLGDSVAGGRAMRAEELLTRALPESLRLMAWASQERPMLGRVERDAFGDEAKLETLFLLERR